MRMLVLRAAVVVAVSSVLAVGPIASASAATETETPESTCHEYEGAAVSLFGTIRLETFPGKPNFTSVHRGDEPVSEFVLEVDEPFCVNAQPEREEGALPALADVVRVQIVMPIDRPVEADTLGRLGEKIWLHGKLVPPNSYYHFLPIVMLPRRMTPSVFERPEAPEVPDFRPEDAAVPGTLDPVAEPEPSG